MRTLYSAASAAAVLAMSTAVALADVSSSDLPDQTNVVTANISVTYLIGGFAALSAIMLLLSVAKTATWNVFRAISFGKKG